MGGPEKNSPLRHLRAAWEVLKDQNLPENYLGKIVAYIVATLHDIQVFSRKNVSYLPMI